MGSVNMIRKAMVVTKRISLTTSIFSSAIASSSGFSLLCFLTARAMTIRGKVSGKKHMPMANAAPIMTLIQKIHGKPILTLSAIHSPTGEPRDGPVLAEATNSAMGWPAPSESPNKSAIVPATLHRATLPAVPQRNWKTISMGRLTALAQPMLSRA